MKRQFVHIKPSQQKRSVEKSRQFVHIHAPGNQGNKQTATPIQEETNSAHASQQSPVHFQDASSFLASHQSPDQGLLSSWKGNIVKPEKSGSTTKRNFQPVVSSAYTPAPPQHSPISQPYTAHPGIYLNRTRRADPNTPPYSLHSVAKPFIASRPATHYQNRSQTYIGTPFGYAGTGNKLPPPPQSKPPSTPPGGTPPRHKRKRRFPIWARVAVATLIVLLVLIGSGVGYYYATFDNTVKNTVGQVVTRPSGDNDPSGTTANNGNILSGKRINILLLGSDTDVKFTDASGHSVYLAQTDIVVTIDPATQSVGMLSIPRDTWLNAPGYGMMKLDEVYKAGGVALSRYTINQDFGIYIDYYAWVGLDGFIKVIDTVGGVDVDVLHPIVDDNYPDDIGNHGNDIYALKRLYLAPGPQHLSGPDALEYVRSRHADLVGDFGRSIRQQQVLTQLKTKLNNPNIISKLPELANDLDGYVKTDMQLADVLRLMNFARSLDQSKINRVTLGPPYSHPAQTNGQDVVQLDCGQVQPIIAQMFNLGDQAKCDLQGNSTTHTSIPSVTYSSSGAAFLASPSQQAASHSVYDTNANTETNNFSGIHSLLDLMFFVVFESPEATTV